MNESSKISYDRRDYESVGEKGLSWAMSRKQNSAGNGLNQMFLKYVDAVEQMQSRIL